MASCVTRVSQRRYGKITPFCGAKPPSEIDRRVVDHFLNDEEGPGLADARQRDQLLAMDPVEILHVSDPDLEEIVEIAGHQVAIQHEFQFCGCPLEGGE